MSRGGNVCSKCGGIMPTVEGVVQVFAGGLGSCCSRRYARPVGVWFTAKGAAKVLKDRYVDLFIGEPRRGR